MESFRSQAVFSCFHVKDNFLLDVKMFVPRIFAIILIYTYFFINILIYSTIYDTQIMSNYFVYKN